MYPREKLNESKQLPPCQAACPLHQDVREYVRLGALGDWRGAMEIIRRTNPLPSLCGQICAHHCEEECRRQQVDKPISIQGIKRYAVEKAAAEVPLVPSPGAGTGKAVAVIGAGPSGLTAAHDLFQGGCRVTVFEREKEAGGAPRNYIPLYRLPDEVLDRDIDALKSLGINFSMGQELGKDFNVDDLKDRGFDAVLLALGLPASNFLPIPGRDLPKVEGALDFLNQVRHQGRRLPDGETVIVIGGGNVAMDVARTAVRVGAKKVLLACLESAEEMPAFSWEIEEAKEEGVEFYNSWGPVEITEKDGNVSGLALKRCKSVFGADGRFNPCYDEEEKTVLQGDRVIFSIGQAGDSSCLTDSSVELTDRGRIVFDSVTGLTSSQGIFACGEVVRGPATAVKAMADGRKIAASILAYLKGEEYIPEEEPEPLPVLDDEVVNNVKKLPRQEKPLAPLEERRCSMMMVEEGFSAEQAAAEARRCMGCGAGAVRLEEVCADCLSCLRTCPFGVPQLIDGKLEIRSEVCQACGLCLSICPARAIQFASPFVAEAEDELYAVLEQHRDEKLELLVIACGYGEYAYVNSIPGTVMVKFPCLAKIDTVHLLNAFQGAEAVLLTGCKDETCQFQQVAHLVDGRVSRVKASLEAIGLSPARLGYVQLTEEEIKELPRVVEEWKKENLSLAE